MGVARLLLAAYHMRVVWHCCGFCSSFGCMLSWHTVAAVVVVVVTAAAGANTPTTVVVCIVGHEQRGDDDDADDEWQGWRPWGWPGCRTQYMLQSSVC